jgi:hypothetical protein
MYEEEFRISNTVEQLWCPEVLGTSGAGCLSSHV